MSHKADVNRFRLGKSITWTVSSMGPIFEGRERRACIVLAFLLRKFLARFSKMNIIQIFIEFNFYRAEFVIMGTRRQRALLQESAVTGDKFLSFPILNKALTSYSKEYKFSAPGFRRNAKLFKMYSKKLPTRQSRLVVRYLAARMDGKLISQTTRGFIRPSFTTYEDYNSSFAYEYWLFKNCRIVSSNNLHYSLMHGDNTYDIGKTAVRAPAVTEAFDKSIDSGFLAEIDSDFSDIEGPRRRRYESSSSDDTSDSEFERKPGDYPDGIDPDLETFSEGDDSEFSSSDDSSFFSKKNVLKKKDYVLENFNYITNENITGDDASYDDYYTKLLLILKSIETLNVSTLAELELNQLDFLNKTDFIDRIVAGLDVSALAAGSFLKTAFAQKNNLSSGAFINFYIKTCLNYEFLKFLNLRKELTHVFALVSTLKNKRELLRSLTPFPSGCETFDGLRLNQSTNILLSRPLARYFKSRGLLARVNWRAGRNSVSYKKYYSNYMQKKKLLLKNTLFQSAATAGGKKSKQSSIVLKKYLSKSRSFADRLSYRLDPYAGSRQNKKKRSVASTLKRVKFRDHLDGKKLALFARRFLKNFNKKSKIVKKFKFKKSCNTSIPPKNNFLPRRNPKFSRSSMSPLAVFLYLMTNRKKNVILKKPYYFTKLAAYQLASFFQFTKPAPRVLYNKKYTLAFWNLGAFDANLWKRDWFIAANIYYFSRSLESHISKFSMRPFINDKLFSLWLKKGLSGFFEYPVKIKFINIMSYFDTSVGKVYKPLIFSLTNSLTKRPKEKVYITAFYYHLILSFIFKKPGIVLDFLARLLRDAKKSEFSKYLNALTAAINILDTRQFGVSGLKIALYGRYGHKLRASVFTYEKGRKSAFRKDSQHVMHARKPFLPAPSLSMLHIWIFR